MNDLKFAALRQLLKTPASPPVAVLTPCSGNAELMVTTEMVQGLSVTAACPVNFQYPDTARVASFYNSPNSQPKCDHIRPPILRDQRDQSTRCRKHGICGNKGRPEFTLHRTRANRPKSAASHGSTDF